MFRLLFLEEIVLPFKYTGNKTSKICARYATHIFFIFAFLSHISNIYVSENFFSVVILKLILHFSVSSNLFHFINLNSLLAGNCEKFHLVEASVVSNNVDIFCISETFIESSVYKIYDELNLKYYTLV